MSVKTYSLAKDGDTKLSENFTVREFRCKDGSDRILISPQTVKILQSVRDYFGKSVHINSAYRTPAYNKKVGGASASQHIKGTACDIVVKDVPPEAVAAYLEEHYPVSGIGLYNRTSHFVHVDTRGYKVYWKNKGNATCKTFGLGKMYETYQAKTKPDQEIEEQEEEMTQEQFNQMMETYLAERAKQEPGSWSADDRKWAESNGIIQGDTDGAKRYKSFITREEAAVMLHRTAEL